MPKLFFVILLLVLNGPLLAQQDLPPGLVPPRPGEPADPPPQPASAFARPDPNAIQTAKGQRWEALNMNGNDVAILYHKLTGKVVLVSSAAAQAEISFILPGPLTNAQAARLLEKKLLLEGFSLEESGPMTLKLVLASGAGGTTPTESVTVIEDISELDPDSDEFVRWIMKLENLKPEDASRVFQQVVRQFGPAGSVTPVPNAASVVVSGNSPLLRMIDKLRERIDVPSAEVGQKFVTVQYADVESLATQLNEIFNQQTQQRQTARVQRTQQGGANRGANQVPGLAANNQGGGAGEDTPINILPDLRTGRIFLMGRPVDIAFVEGLIRDFDQPSSERNFWTRKLSYLPVTEFIPIAQDSLTRLLGDSATGPGGGATGNRNNVTNRNTNRNQPNTNQPGGVGGAGGAGGARGGVSTEERETAPESFIVGKTQLVADNVSNTILVNGPPHHVEVIAKLADELDRPSQQIAITVVFGSYDIMDNRSFGVDFASLLNTSNDTFAGLTGNGVPSVIDPTMLNDLTDILAPSTGGLNLFGSFAGDLGVFVTALETHMGLETIQRPTIFTTNNKTARISSGQRIAVPTTSFAGNVGNVSSTNIEFRDILLELEVLPLVNSNGEVTLDISLVRDDVDGERTVGDVAGIPDITTEEINTIVTAPDRSTIIIGGLITEDQNSNENGVPILSSIPGIGYLFKQTSVEVERDELVILIQATVVDGQEALGNFQRESEINYPVSKTAREAIAPPVLPQKGTVPSPQATQGSGVPQAIQVPEPKAVSASRKERKKFGIRNGKRR